MMKKLWIPIVLILCLALAGCPKPMVAPSPTGISSSTVVPAGERTPFADQFTIAGKVDLPAFKTQATLTEVASASTVSLIEVTSGRTVGSTVTLPDGRFLLTFGATFRPVNNELYLLEAVKGLQAGATPNRAGASAARVRTLLQWRTNAWASMTVGGITISPSTTALCIIAGLRQFAGGTPVTQSELIESVTSGSPDSFDPKSSGISQAEYASVYSLVNSALNLDEDPVFVILYNVATQTYGKATTPVGVANVVPAIARINDYIEILGNNFIADVTQDRVFFNGTEAGDVSVLNYGTRLRVRVPLGATTGPLTVRIGDNIFGGLSFTVQSWDGHTPFDTNGNLFVVGHANNTLYRMSPNGVMTRILEGGGLNRPNGVAVNGSMVYVSNSGANTVIRIDTANGNAVSTYATGLSNPHGMAFDGSGNLYVANAGANNVVRIPAGGGSTSVYASGFSTPVGLAFDLSGHLWVSNYGGTYSIARIDSTTQAVTTEISAGSLNQPWGLAFDSNGDLYIANRGENQILLYRAGALTPVLANPGTHKGINSVAFDTNGLLYVGCYDSHTMFTRNRQGGIRDIALVPRNAWGVAKDSANNLYVTINTATTRRYGYFPRDSRVYRMAYDAGTQSYGPPVPYLDGFSEPTCVAFDSTGRMHVGDAASGRIYRVDPTTGVKTIHAEGYGGIVQMAFDSTNRLYVSLRNSSTYRLAANGTQEYNYGNNLDRNLKGVAIGSDGNYYAASYREGVIQRINPTTNETTRWITGLTNLGGLVSNGNYLYVAEQGGNRVVRYDITVGASSRMVICNSGLSSPSDIALDAANSRLLVGNYGNGTICSVPLAGGAATTLVSGIPTFSGRPWALPVAYSTNVIWSADMRPGERRVLRIDISGGTPVTYSAATHNFAQMPVGIDSLDGTPWGMAVHTNGNLYVTDGRRWWGRLVAVNMTTGAVTPYGAMGTWLGGLTIDANGDILAANMQNRGQSGYRIIKFNPTGSVIANYGSHQWRTMGVAVDASDRVFSLTSFWGVSWYYINRFTSDQSWVRHSNFPGYAGANNLHIDASNNMYFGYNRGERACKIRADGAQFIYSSVGFCNGLIPTPNGDLYGVSTWNAVDNVPVFRIPAANVDSNATAVVPNHWSYRPVF